MGRADRARPERRVRAGKTVWMVCSTAEVAAVMADVVCRGRRAILDCKEEMAATAAYWL